MPSVGCHSEVVCDGVDMTNLLELETVRKRLNHRVTEDTEKTTQRRGWVKTEIPLLQEEYFSSLFIFFLLCVLCDSVVHSFWLLSGFEDDLDAFVRLVAE